MAGREKQRKGGSDAEETCMCFMKPKGQALTPLTKGPSRDPQPLGREILSLTHCSGLFLGQWVMEMCTCQAPE